MVFDPVTQALLISGASTLIGKIASWTQRVDDPVDLYDRNLEKVRESPLPAHLSDEEMRELAFSLPRDDAAAVDAAAKMATKAGKPASHAYRNARAGERVMGLTLQGLNSELKLIEADDAFKSTVILSTAVEKKGAGFDKYKIAEADQQAARAVVEHEDQKRRREAIESAVSFGTGAVLTLGMDPGVRSYVKGALGITGPQGAPAGTYLALDAAGNAVSKYIDPAESKMMEAAGGFAFKPKELAELHNHMADLKNNLQPDDFKTDILKSGSLIPWKEPEIVPDDLPDFSDLAAVVPEKSESFKYSFEYKSPAGETLPDSVIEASAIDSIAIRSGLKDPRMTIGYIRENEDWTGKYHSKWFECTAKVPTVAFGRAATNPCTAEEINRLDARRPGREWVPFTLRSGPRKGEYIEKAIPAFTDDWEAWYLYGNDIANSAKYARDRMANFDDPLMPAEAQSILIDLIYNTGGNNASYTLKDKYGWSFMDAIDAYDWDRAANILDESSWYRRYVKDRADDNILLLRSLGGY